MRARSEKKVKAKKAEIDRKAAIEKGKVNLIEIKLNIS